MKEIKHTEYYATYDPQTATIIIAGILELKGVTEYNPLQNLLLEVAEQKLPMVTLDVQNVEFMNSSGISTLLRFGIKIRDLGVSRLKILGSNQHSWQTKSLKNLQRFVQNADIDIK
jgi:hypothetical protein